MWELDYKESWVLKNWCFWTVLLKKTLESPLDCKEIQPVHPKGDKTWMFIGRTDAEAETPILWPSGCKELTHLKGPWCWARVKAGGEEDDRGWDGSMASPTQWTWVWVNSGSWRWTGRLGMLQSMGSQRVRYQWVTELTDWLKPDERSAQGHKPMRKQAEQWQNSFPNAHPPLTLPDHQVKLWVSYHPFPSAGLAVHSPSSVNVSPTTKLISL